MELANHPNASTLTLDQLVTHALKELKRLKYSRRSVRRYRLAWRELIAFSHAEKLGDKYSDDIAARFIAAMRLERTDRTKPNERRRRHVVFMVRVLADFARDARVERTRTDMRQMCVPEAMKKTLCDYEQYARTRRYLRPTTLRAQICTLSVFTCFLESRGVTHLNKIRPEDITSFVVSRTRLGARATSTTLSFVRSFLRFLLLRGILQTDLTPALPPVRVPRDATIPSVWDPELVEKLLKVVDRSSPIGKRDYAILLLAARLGMRLADIRALTLDELKWDTAAIEITQSKTARAAVLADDRRGRRGADRVSQVRSSPDAPIASCFSGAGHLSRRSPTIVISITSSRAGVSWREFSSAANSTVACIRCATPWRRSCCASRRRFMSSPISSATRRRHRP